MDSNMPMRGEMEQGKTCKCMHHKVVPLLIVLFAGVFLLEDFQILTPSATNIAWPVIVGLVGIMKLVEGGCKCC